MKKRIIENFVDNSLLPDVTSGEYFKALGYFSQWSDYETVSISNDRKNDLIGYFYDRGTTRTPYIIGAIWNQETLTYSFHS